MSDAQSHTPRESASGPSNTVKDLRALSHVLCGSDDRELLQHAADMIEMLSGASSEKPLRDVALKCADICEQALHDHRDDAPHVGRVKAVASIRQYAATLDAPVQASGDKGSTEIPAYYVAVHSGAEPYDKFDFPIVDNIGLKASPSGAWMRAHDVLKALKNAGGVSAIGLREAHDLLHQAALALEACTGPADCCGMAHLGAREWPLKLEVLDRVQQYLRSSDSGASAK